MNAATVNRVHFAMEEFGIPESNWSFTRKGKTITGVDVVAKGQKIHIAVPKSLSGRRPEELPSLIREKLVR